MGDLNFRITFEFDLFHIPPLFAAKGDCLEFHPEGSLSTLLNVAEPGIVMFPSSDIYDIFVTGRPEVDF